MDSPPREPDDQPIRPERFEIYDAQGNPVHRKEPRPRPKRPVISMAVLGICVFIFLAVNVIITGLGHPQFLYYLTFSPGHGMVFPGLLTHMFAHADLWHLVFNMIMLYFLGFMVEMRYGTTRFAILYFASGVFAALAQAAFDPGGLLLGASGALAGVLAAFIRHYPHVRLYIWGILPVPAWLVGVIWMGTNIWGTLRQGEGIAFIAHLAGFAAGMAISLIMIAPGRGAGRKPVQ